MSHDDRSLDVFFFSLEDGNDLATIEAELFAIESGEGEPRRVTALAEANGFLPGMMGGLYYVLLGDPSDQEGYPIVRTIDVKRPYFDDAESAPEEEGEVPDFPEPYGGERWMFWALPPRLVERVAALDASERAEVIAKWGETRCHTWLRGSIDLDVRPLEDVLSALQEVARVAAPKGHQVFLAQGAEA